ncbi:MAG: rhodanese-like domain-containing protein [Candidatus Zixiibacteriota bacterium]
MVYKQLVVLLIFAIILGMGANLLSPNKIEFISAYRDLSGSDGPIIPPDAVENDPPFIDINVAHFEHSTQRTIFIDAREPEEFNCGTIPGSINIPFDLLPDGDLKLYFDSCLGHIAYDQPIVTYCSGEECDLSLHLARNLADNGYTNIMIFFGGSREWEKFGLPIERRTECGE